MKNSCKFWPFFDSILCPFVLFVVKENFNLRPRASLNRRANTIRACRYASLPKQRRARRPHQTPLANDWRTDTIGRRVLIQQNRIRDGALINRCRDFSRTPETRRKRGRTRCERPCRPDRYRSNRCDNNRSSDRTNKIATARPERCAQKKWKAGTWGKDEG